MTASPKKKARRAIAARVEEIKEEVGLTPQPFTVALVGRPNVGKSSLFNRLAGKRVAIVTDIAGTTRDWKEEEGQLSDLRFTVLDTGGLEDQPMTDSIEARMQEHTARAIQNADVVLFMTDARQGISDSDRHFARWLRRQRRAPVLLLANKTESFFGSVDGEDRWLPFEADAYSLGLGSPIPVSAEHGEGLVALYEALRPFSVPPASLPEVPGQEGEATQPPAWTDEELVQEAIRRAEGELAAKEEEEAAKERGEEQTIATAAATRGAEREADRLRKQELPLHVAIVGRPNVGKSTLLNQLVQDERVLAGPTAGLTRDAIMVEWEYEGRSVKLVDTAGMRRWGLRDLRTPLESLSVGYARRALAMANVVLLVVDAETGVTKQDASLAQSIVDEGRALVVLINKCDAIFDYEQAVDVIRKQVEYTVTGAKGVHCVPISALRGTDVDKIMPSVIRTYDAWNTRVGTSLLNRWFERLCRHHPPPAALKTVVRRGAGRDKQQATKTSPLRIKFLTQVSARPPTFAVFANRAGIPEHYLRFLGNAIREEFGLGGVPIRLLPRSPKNPFNHRPSGGAALGGTGPRAGRKSSVPSALAKERQESDPAVRRRRAFREALRRRQRETRKTEGRAEMETNATGRKSGGSMEDDLRAVAARAAKLVPRPER